MYKSRYHDKSTQSFYINLELFPGKHMFYCYTDICLLFSSCIIGLKLPIVYIHITDINILQYHTWQLWISIKYAISEKKWFSKWPADIYTPKTGVYDLYILYKLHVYSIFAKYISRGESKKGSSVYK